MLIYQKEIDRSTLRQGFQIPVSFHDLLKLIPGGMPCHGETRNIKIIIAGEEFDAQLKNQGFDRRKFGSHAPVLQVRYGENSPLANRLRLLFHETWDYVELIKNLPGNQNRKFVIHIPEERQEFLALSSTDMPNVFVADFTTLSERKLCHQELGLLSELEFETFEPRVDVNASVKSVEGVRKIRHLDRSIGDSLKRLYDYRCQMTGEKVGEAQGVACVEAHHIVPFTESLNNDTSNIIILSPSYHRIVHKARPEFDREKMLFRFPNGLQEKVLLDKHLFIK